MHPCIVSPLEKRVVDPLQKLTARFDQQLFIIWQQSFRGNPIQQVVTNLHSTIDEIGLDYELDVVKVAANDS